MTNRLTRFFKLEENGTNIRTEALGGAATFMTMSYIVFMQPAVLAAAGMDKGAVMVATCLSAALATLLMGLMANYPIALAPAVGHNVFFAVIVCGTMGYSWQIALGAVFISGTVFILLSLLGIWDGVVSAVPDSLKFSIAVGIGLLIALVGLEYGGLVVDDPVVLVRIGDWTSKPALLALFGIALTSILMARRVKAAILLGIVATAFLGVPLGVVRYHGLIAPPPSISPTLFKLDIAGAVQTGLIAVIFIFFILDLFDTVGTLIGVSGQAGYLRDGRLPRANRAMAADAVGTVVGAFLGTSTVTSYVESAAGIAQGARTGLANVFTAGFFLIALFFGPLAEMIGGDYILPVPGMGGGEAVTREIILRPVLAAPLIIVGFLMMKCVKYIDWEDVTEAVPAFLTMIVMPLTLSITEGIAAGFISYCLLKLATGKGRRVHWLIYFFSLLFIVRFIVS